MTGARVDASEVMDLARDITMSAVAVGIGAATLVRTTAAKIKDEWRDNAKESSGAHARRYPYSISYDLDVGGLAAEIGPVKGKSQGALGNLLEFGSVHNPPHNDGGRALAHQAPLFEGYAAQLARTALTATGRSSHGSAR